MKYIQPKITLSLITFPKIIPITYIIKKNNNS